MDSQKDFIDELLRKDRRHREALKQVNPDDKTEELVIDPQAITAGQTIDEIRAKALATKG